MNGSPPSPPVRPVTREAAVSRTTAPGSLPLHRCAGTGMSGVPSFEPDA